MKCITIRLLPMLFAFTVNGHPLISGTVVGWGTGKPAAIPRGPDCALTNVVAISAGSAHALALLDNGVVFGWGFDHYGQVSGQKMPGKDEASGIVRINGQPLHNVTAISAWDNSSVAFMRNSTLIGWGRERVSTDVSNIIQLTKGTVALKSDGRVIGWGDSKVPSDCSDITAIGGSGNPGGDILAAKNDGTVLKWNDWRGDLTRIKGLTNVIAVAVGTGHFGGFHYLALKSDGTVFGWGANDDGQATGIKNGADGLVTINRQILTNVVAIAAVMECSLALKRSGDVVAWGNNMFHQTDVPAGLSNVVAVAAGNRFCLAITTNCIDMNVK